MDRKVDWEYLVLAFFATVIIMSLIFFAGQGLSNQKVDSLRDNVKQIEVEQRSQALGLQIAESVEGQKCEAMKSWISSSVPEIRDLRKKVADYESSSKMENREYELVKKRYMNLIIQNLIEVRSMEEECGENVVNVIYLYTNNGCPRCEGQGSVLTYYRRQYDDVMVHPLDTDLKMESIEFIQDFYEVEQYPALIIEGEVYEGFQNRQQLGEIIESNLNQSQENADLNLTNATRTDNQINNSVNQSE